MNSATLATVASATNAMPRGRARRRAKGTRARAQSRQRGGEQHADTEHQQQQQPAQAHRERVGALVARNRPRSVECVLQGAGGAQAAVERSEDPERQARAAAPQPPHAVADLRSDDREIRERRVDEPGLEPGIVLQCEAEDRDQQQQQRKQRQKAVVGDEGRQIRSLVVAELVQNRDRKAQPAVPALVAVDRVDRA